MSEYRPTPRFNVHTVAREPYPEWGGDQAMLHISPDGRFVAGSFREEGRNTVVLPFDQFVYVVAGRMSVEAMISMHTGSLATS